MSSIGLMDPAFFVGKNVLLKWLNDFFDAGVSKVEQMSTGSIACQVFDAIYPNAVPLHKVNFEAKAQPEYVLNWKILQSVLDQQQIAKHIDVNKLINSKFQDNLEFLQWLKQFFDKNYSGQEYNAKERREQAKAQYKKTHKFAGRGTSNNLNNASKPIAAAKTHSSTTSLSTSTGSKPSSKPSSSHGTTATKSTAKSTSSQSKSTSSSANNPDAATVAALRVNVENLEKERNFYFGKLREIEILCQEEDTSQWSNEVLKQKVLQILYQTDEDFKSPSEDNEDNENQENQPNNTLQQQQQQQQGLLSDEDAQQTF